MTWSVKCAAFVTAFLLFLSATKFILYFPLYTAAMLRSLFQIPPSINNHRSFCESNGKVIPRTIHQMGPPYYRSRQWMHNQQKWISNYSVTLHYEYRYWTDDKIEEFVIRNYPELLSLYLSYPNDVQRYDMARYLILFSEVWHKLLRGGVVGRGTHARRFSAAFCARAGQTNRGL